MNKTTCYLLLSIVMMLPQVAAAQVLHGDANGDGEVNIADVNAVIDAIFEGATSSLVDVNNDQEVNIADVNDVIDIILAGANPPPPVTTTFTANGVSFTMVFVEGGTFMMGRTTDPDPNAGNNEFPRHQVTVSSFSIGQTEVTQALWLAVMGKNPSYTSSANGYTEDLERPVEQVSWNDCNIFLIKLSFLVGRQFRLPTEAEWEFAARGGNLSKGYKYSGSDEVDSVAWHWYEIPSQSPGTDGFGTQPVATKKPNELWLYDMSGNVEEWCHDWYRDYYNYLPETDPTGPTSGTLRVRRGGYWHGHWNTCRVGHRFYGGVNSSDYSIGLRLAL